MQRKLLGGLASLALVAVLAVPVAAQAEPHWYIGGIKLVKKKTVKTEGGLTLGPIPGTTITVSCKIRDAETLENPTGGGAGVDIMKAFKVLSCGPNPCPVNSAGVQGALKIKALKLPWASKLVEVPPIADEFTGVELELSCKGTGVFAVISGHSHRGSIRASSNSPPGRARSTSSATTRSCRRRPKPRTRRRRGTHSDTP